MKEINFKHIQSAHCENGVAANILTHNGLNINEPLLFGIGSGLFFIYIPFLKINYAPAISYRPIPGIIFDRASKRLGVEIVRKKFKSVKKSFDILDQNIDQGIVTGLQVGVFQLPYFPDEYRFHFNAHNLIVYGKKNEEYLVSDPVMEHTTTLTRKELEKVRFAKGTFAPKGHLYYPTKIPTEVNFQKAIKEGIVKTANDMTAPVPIVGANGIRFLGKKIKSWPDKVGEKKARHYLAQIIRMQEEIGTGGGGFRYIYGAFLQQAAEILNHSQLNDFSNEMTLIGDQWRDFALSASKICKERAKDGESYQKLSDMVVEISKTEKEFFKSLKKEMKNIG